METELTDNYTNKSRVRLSKKVLFHKQGDALYTIIHGQLSSNVIAAAKNSTSPDYKQTHKDLSVCIKNISGTKVDPLFNALKII